MQTVRPGFDASRSGRARCRPHGVDAHGRLVEQEDVRLGASARASDTSFDWP